MERLSLHKQQWGGTVADQPVDFNERSREISKCMTVEVLSSDEEHDSEFFCDGIWF